MSRARRRLPRARRPESTIDRGAALPGLGDGDGSGCAAPDVDAGGSATPTGTRRQWTRALAEGRASSHVQHRSQGAATRRALDRGAALQLGAPSRPARCLSGGRRRMTERSIEHAGFTIQRRYRAAPERVFAAWADPAAKAHWFAGPEEWEAGPEHGAFFDGLEDPDVRRGGWGPLLDALARELERN